MPDRSGSLLTPVQKVLHSLLPDIGTEEFPMSSSCVHGHPTKDFLEPRLAVMQYTDPVDRLFFRMYVGNHQWIEQEFTAEQSLQIAAAILTRPLMGDLVEKFLDILIEAKSQP